MALAVEQRTDPATIVADLIARARKAQLAVRDYSQAQANDLVTAIAWACYKPENAQRMARLAIEDTGLGRYEDKVIKNQRKTFGTLRDLLDPGAISVGVIREDRELGLTLIAKPVGVVAAICPSTNPSATPINKTMMIIKGRNATILAPSPKGATTCELVVQLVHEQLKKIGAPLDLVQMLPQPISKELTNELMRQADVVVATGSQNNVRNAYSSGTPALGVGAGNTPAIIDETADLDDAASKIKLSKCFDYATSCSSENSVLIPASRYESTLDALRRQGGYLLDTKQKAQLQTAMFPDGHLSQKIIAQSPKTIAEVAGFTDPAAHAAEFFMVEETGVGDEYPFSGEKLSVVLTVYRYESFDDAVALVGRILHYSGMGHSVAIHTKKPERPERLAHELDVVRVLVNQPHSFNNGGGFDNGLNFTLTMGCGSWAKNSISENLSYKHFLNTTHLVRQIPERKPSEEALFGSYWKRFGK
jgi:sulfoacetaldehyde dehydrogenase